MRFSPTYTDWRGVFGHSPEEYAAEKAHNSRMLDLRHNQPGGRWSYARIAEHLGVSRYMATKLVKRAEKDFSR